MNTGCFKAGSHASFIKKDGEISKYPQHWIATVTNSTGVVWFCEGFGRKSFAIKAATKKAIQMNKDSNR